MGWRRGLDELQIEQGLLVYWRVDPHVPCPNDDSHMDGNLQGTVRILIEMPRIYSRLILPR